MIKSVPRGAKLNTDAREVSFRVLSGTDKPSKGFVRRPRPVWPEFAIKMTWFSRIEFSVNGRDGMVYCWVSKEENAAYERGHMRKRFCKTYRGQPIEKS